MGDEKMGSHCAVKTVSHNYHFTKKIAYPNWISKIIFEKMWWCVRLSKLKNILNDLKQTILYVGDQIWNKLVTHCNTYH